MSCGYYAVNNKHCLNGNHCIVCNFKKLDLVTGMYHDKTCHGCARRQELWGKTTLQGNVEATLCHRSQLVILHPLDHFNNLVERSSASSKNTATDDLTQQVIPPEYEE